MNNSKNFLIASLITLLFSTSYSWADTIKLKDGRVIKCDFFREEGTVVRYWIGDSILTVSRDKIESLERDKEKGEDLKAFPNQPNNNSDNNSDNNLDTSKPTKLRPIPRFPIVRTIEGNSNMEAVEKLEAELKNDPTDKTKIASLVKTLNIVAFTEQQAGNLDKAKELLNRALSLKEDHIDTLLGLSNINLQEGRYREVVQHSSKILSIDDKNQLGYYFLGSAYYYLNEIQKAVDTWRTGLKLGDNGLIKDALTKAEKELSVSRDFSNERSRFFNLVLEGGSNNLELENQLLITLEASYSQLKRQFNYEPKERINAVFYTKQTFSDITRAPSWAGAVNDGKLRVPVGGLNQINTELSKTITHELAHSFVYFKARGKCPTWLNEGIAQLVEGDSARQYYRQLASLVAQNPSFNLKNLSGSFIRFSPEQAQVAYQYSLAAVELLSERGINITINVLSELAQNSDIDQALSRHTRFRSLNEFEQELKQRLIN